MTLAVSAPQEGHARPNQRGILWALALAFVIVLYIFGDLVPWAVEYPRAWELPLRFWISDFMKWLINDADLGLFTFKELTRSIAWLLDKPYWLARALLADGFVRGWGKDAVEIFPRISWAALIAVISLMGFYVRDW